MSFRGVGPCAVGQRLHSAGLSTLICDPSNSHNKPVSISNTILLFFRQENRGP